MYTIKRNGKTVQYVMTEYESVARSQMEQLRDKDTQIARYCDGLHSLKYINAIAANWTVVKS